jgi:hypothetical protein
LEGAPAAPADHFVDATNMVEPAWMAAFDEARDAILNDRGPLEGEAMTDTQTNAVLGILDDAFMPHLKRGAAPAAPAPEPLTDEQIMGAAFSQRYMDGAQYLIAVGRVIEEACAQQWGVTLGPIAASKGAPKP